MTPCSLSALHSSLFSSLLSSLLSIHLHCECDPVIILSLITLYKSLTSTSCLSANRPLPSLSCLSARIQSTLTRDATSHILFDSKSPTKLLNLRLSSELTPLYSTPTNE